MIKPATKTLRPDIDAGSKAIIESLTLGCPSCKIALDPNPDGCCAIRCMSCSKYFCLLCFTILPNNSQCHEHVRQCSKNPSKNVFAPEYIRQKAHKTLQINAIRHILSTKYGPKWRKISYCKDILKKCSKILKDSKITEEEILLSTEETENEPRIQNHQPIETNLQTKQLYLSFFGGIIVTILFNSLYFLLFSSSSSSSMSCPDSSYQDGGVEFSSNELNEDTLSPLFSSSSSSLPFEREEISFLQSCFIFFWNLFVYLLKGGCWALALNYFTSQSLLNYPLIGILVALLWKPIGILLYYISYAITTILYYLNSSLLVIMIFMAITNNQLDRKKYFVSSALLAVTLAILYGIQSLY